MVLARRVLALVIILSVATACAPTSPVYEIRPTRFIYYMQDPRTNLCFAYYANPSNGLTTVPCEAVEEYLVNETKER